MVKIGDRGHYMLDTLLSGYFVGVLVAITVLRRRAGLPYWAFLQLEVIGNNMLWYTQVIIKSLLWPYFWYAWVKKGKPESVFKAVPRNDAIYIRKVSDIEKETHGPF
jgi:hypothetical protein